MKVVVITQTWNEEEMLPYFLQHYSQFADEIIILDDGSTDSTCEIARTCNVARVEHRLATGGLIDDEERTRVANTFYKTIYADWYVIVDVDEAVYHPSGDVRAVLEECSRQGITVPRCEGYRMVGTSLPPKGTSLTKHIRTGIHDTMYDKVAVFARDVVPVYHPGRHHTKSLTGSVVQSKWPVFMFLHYKYPSREFVQARIARTQMSPRNYELYLGFMPDGREGKDAWMEIYEQTLHDAVRII